MPTTDNLTLGKWLSRVAEQNASDLHLAVGTQPVMRLEGKLIVLSDEEIITASFLERLILSVLSEKQKEELSREKNITFTTTLNKNLRFKVNISYQKGYLSASFRYIPDVTRTLIELGLPEVISRLLKSEKGLFIVSGPFDSGKSTTVAAMINFINREEARYIVTLERPIEHIFTNNKSIIEQKEVGVDTPTFTRGIKFILEEDVEVVVLSEFNAQEIVAPAFELIESGRLVIAVMDTNSVLDTLEKIHGLFPSSSQSWAKSVLASDLLGVVSQRLLAKIGGGRVLAYELLVNSPSIKSVILEGKFDRIMNFLQTSREQGMTSLDRSLADLVRKGEVKLEEALEEAIDPDGLKNMLRG